MDCGINSKQGQEDNFKIDNFFSKGKKRGEIKMHAFSLGYVNTEVLWGSVT